MSDQETPISTGETKEEPKKMTTGKILGSIAFIVSEILVMMGGAYCILSLFSENGMDSNTFVATLTFQGTIFVTVWGAKLGSNFAKKK